MRCRPRSRQARDRAPHIPGAVGGRQRDTDLVIDTTDQHPLHIEFRVTHQVYEDKLNRLKLVRIYEALEIDHCWQ